MYEVDRLHGWLPKIIHQTYPDRQPPSMYQQNIERIKQLSPGWQYRLYDDQDIQDYIAKHFPALLGYYNRIDARYGAARADLFRYLVIYNEGGIYLDIKSSITRPLDEAFPEQETYFLSHWKQRPKDRYGDLNILDDKGNVLFPWPERGEFQQWFIVSPPRHPFLQQIIEKVCGNIDRYSRITGEVGKGGVLKLTGPIAYTHAILPIINTVDHSIIDVEDDLGFQYSFLQSFNQHKTSFPIKHYSRLKRPIIKPKGIENFLFLFVAFTRYFFDMFKRIKKSISKRHKRAFSPPQTAKSTDPSSLSAEVVCSPLSRQPCRKQPLDTT